ncbi:GGDEF domain-containing protein [Sulfurovum sp.]|uniref:GGDEF domain-containing protein n=1 Tax=Sulfurovum sp. TaxID=1969726 RepID=UPI0028682125|nr:GGDEF domain-containing protein [Sulfurovum sp.]
MTLNNFLYSGFKFNEDENLLQFKFMMLNSIFIIVAFFSTSIGLLSDFGMYDIGPIQTKVKYIYSFMTIFLIFFLRLSKTHYEKTAHCFLIISLLVCTSALIFVPQDEFRIIWFYLLIFVAYILKGTTGGLFYTAASVVIILTLNFFMELHLSQIAISSSIFALIIGSLLYLVHTKKITAYEKNLKQKNSSLSLLASTDYLTGIMNGRMFSELSKRYFKTAERDGFSLTFFLLDLDYFKNINDTYGHQAGDRLLKYFVETVENTLRASDIFARIGGEEFAILVSKTNIDDGYVFAEKIRRKIENISMEYEGHQISITVSIGMAENCKTDNSFDDIFFRADTALYKAKNEGRNRICYISPLSDKKIEDPKLEKRKAFLNFSI